MAIDLSHLADASIGSTMGDQLNDQQIHALLQQQLASIGQANVAAETARQMPISTTLGVWNLEQAQYYDTLGEGRRIEQEQLRLKTPTVESEQVYLQQLLRSKTAIAKTIGDLTEQGIGDLTPTERNEMARNIKDLQKVLREMEVAEAKSKRSTAQYEGTVTEARIPSATQTGRLLETTTQQRIESQGEGAVTDTARARMLLQPRTPGGAPRLTEAEDLRLEGMESQQAYQQALTQQVGATIQSIQSQIQSAGVQDAMTVAQTQALQAQAQRNAQEFLPLGAMLQRFTNESTTLGHQRALDNYLSARNQMSIADRGFLATARTVTDKLTQDYAEKAAAAAAEADPTKKAQLQGEADSLMLQIYKLSAQGSPTVGNFVAMMSMVGRPEFQSMTDELAKMDPATAALVMGMGGMGGVVRDQRYAQQQIEKDLRTEAGRKFNKVWSKQDGMGRDEYIKRTGTGAYTDMTDAGLEFWHEIQLMRAGVRQPDGTFTGMLTAEQFYSEHPVGTQFAMNSYSQYAPGIANGWLIHRVQASPTVRDTPAFAPVRAPGGDLDEVATAGWKRILYSVARMPEVDDRAMPSVLPTAFGTLAVYLGSHFKPIRDSLVADIDTQLTVTTDPTLREQYTYMRDRLQKDVIPPPDEAVEAFRNKLGLPSMYTTHRKRRVRRDTLRDYPR